MIAFGICVGPTGRFESIALPALERVREADSLLIVRRDSPSIATAYNSIAQEAAAHADLEALVLIHDDVEILDRRFSQTVRDALVAPDVGILGVIGGRGVRRQMSWSRSPQKLGAARDTGRVLDYGFDSTDADVVDGIVVCLSARALRELRFDDHRYPGFHGYDADICAQAIHRGLRVVVIDTPIRHHSHPAPDPRAAKLEYAHADQVWRSKWSSPIWLRPYWRVRSRVFAWWHRAQLSRRPISRADA